MKQITIIVVVLSLLVVGCTSAKSSKVFDCDQVDGFPWYDQSRAIRPEIMQRLQESSLKVFQETGVYVFGILYDPNTSGEMWVELIEHYGECKGLSYGQTTPAITFAVTAVDYENLDEVDNNMGEIWWISWNETLLSPDLPGYAWELFFVPNSEDWQEGLALMIENLFTPFQ